MQPAKKDPLTSSQLRDPQASAILRYNSRHPTLSTKDQSAPIGTVLHSLRADWPHNPQWTGVVSADSALSCTRLSTFNNLLAPTAKRV